MLYFVKVRIDVDKLKELGQKIQTGEYDRSKLKWTYCLKDDPSVGINIYETDTYESFEKVFSLHKIYFKEVLEILPLISTQESMMILMKGISKQD